MALVAGAGRRCTYTVCTYLLTYYLLDSSSSSSSTTTTTYYSQTDRQTVRPRLNKGLNHCQSKQVFFLTYLLTVLAYFFLTYLLTVLAARDRWAKYRLSRMVAAGKPAGIALG